MAVRRKDRIEDMLHHALAADEREPFQEFHPIGDEGRQPQGARESEGFITEQRKRQMEPAMHLLLPRRGLGAEPADIRTERCQLCVMIAEAATLRSAAARPRDLIPARRQRDSGPSGHRIGIDDGQARLRGKIQPFSGGGEQREIRQTGAGQMGTRAVILRHRQVRREFGERASIHRRPDSAFACAAVPHCFTRK